MRGAGCRINANANVRKIAMEMLIVTMRMKTSLRMQMMPVIESLLKKLMTATIRSMKTWYKSQLKRRIAELI